jgi:membrane protease YdiL (CAAX protease family)
MAPLTEKNRKQFGWGAPQAILVTVAIFFLSQVVAVALVSFYAGARHMTGQEATRWLDGSVAAQFALVAFVEAITIGLLYWFLRRYKTSFRDLGLVKPRLRDLGYALAGFGVYFPVYLVAILLAQTLTHINVGQKQQLGFSSASGGELILVFVSLVLLPPLVEEILVRGFLYGSLKKHWSKIQAVLVTSLLFALAHLQFGSGAPLLWTAALDTFILSLVLIYLRDKTGSLSASIMLHMLKNGLAFAALFLIK